MAVSGASLADSQSKIQMTEPNADVMDGMLARRAALERQRDYYARMVNDCEHKIEKIDQDLEPMARAWRIMVGRSKCELLHGTLTVIKAREKMQILDSKALNDWLEKRFLNGKFWHAVPNHTAMRAELKPQGDSYADPMTGEIAPGVRHYTPTEHDFTVKIKTGGTHGGEEEESE